MSLTKKQRRALRRLKHAFEASPFQEKPFLQFVVDHHHELSIQANEAGLAQFGLICLDAADSDKTYISLAREEDGQDWITGNSLEYLEPTYIEKLSLEEWQRRQDPQAPQESEGSSPGCMLAMLALVAAVGFIIYLFWFWVVH